MVETKEDNRKIYSSVDAKDLIDSSGFTRTFIDILVKCFGLKSKEVLSYRAYTVGIIGINFNDYVIIRTYMDLRYSDKKVEVSNMPFCELLMEYEADLVIDYDKNTRKIKITTNGRDDINNATKAYFTCLARALSDSNLSTCEDLNNFMGVVRHLRSRFV